MVEVEVNGILPGVVAVDHIFGEVRSPIWLGLFGMCNVYVWSCDGLAVKWHFYTINFLVSHFNNLLYT